MFLVKRIACLYVLLILITSCATLPTQSEMRQQIASYELPAKPKDGYAIVYIVRPSSYGAFVSFEIYIGKKDADNEVGSTTGSEHIYFNLSPGTHKIISKAENATEVELQVEADKVYFLEQIPTTGILIARNELKVIDEITGKYHMKNTRPGKVTDKEF